MNTVDFLALDLNDKRRLISSQPTVLQARNELEKAAAISNVINSFVEEYFDLMIDRDNARISGSVLVQENLMDTFQQIVNLEALPQAVAAMRQSIPDANSLRRSGKNIYELSGAVKLSFANKTTRTLSTTMGLLWERLATVSPYVINPETEFGVKIKGVDLIAKNFQTGVIEYQQLKTQHNTLTGSQVPRSIQELSIHENPVFCACFDTNSSWTFRDARIPRVSGQDFWARIGISYHHSILPIATQFISRVEDEYVAILSNI